MRTRSRRVWPLFAGVAMLAVLGLFVIHGTAAGVVLFVDLLAFIGAGISRNQTGPRGPYIDSRTAPPRC